MADHALRNMLISYSHANLAHNDIRSVLQSFKDLRTQMKPFTYGNGQTKSLVCLEGTVPISYKTKTYNIPVIIWLHDTHPYHAPMVYVQPTATMNIKSGPHVDRGGTVTVPYLSDWRQGHSDLTTLVSVLCMVFGESPPVFAKPKNQPPQLPTAASATQPPPYISASGSSMPQPYPSTGTSYPPAPSYPAPSTSYPNPTTTATPQGYNPYSSSTSQPAYPTSTTASSVGGYPGMYGQGPGYGSGMPYPPTTNSYPTSTTGGYQPPTTTAYPTTTGYPSYPTYTNPAAGPEPAELERQKSFGLSDDEIKHSLLSAIQDKMRRRLKDMLSTHKAEMDVLRNTQKDLSAGKTKLDELANLIDTESMECQKTITFLSTKNPELKAEVEKSESSQGDLAPEDSIETTAPLYKQLLQSFAEEQAIEDTLYILGDALRREVIGIEIYLKKVRDLSRKQFMLRALMQKCREKAELSDVYS